MKITNLPILKSEEVYKNCLLFLNNLVNIIDGNQLKIKGRFIKVRILGYNNINNYLNLVIHSIINENADIKQVNKKVFHPDHNRIIIIVIDSFV